VSPSAAAQPAIDEPRAVLETVDGDAVLLRELVGLFHEDCPSLLAEIRAASTAGDAGRLGRTAHKLAGAVSNFHARRALYAARKVEEMARLEKLDGAPSAIAELEDALAALHPALDVLVDQAQRGGGV
jgi:protein-histidine pros-kinase